MCKCYKTGGVAFVPFDFTDGGVALCLSERGVAFKPVNITEGSVLCVTVNVNKRGVAVMHVISREEAWSVCCQYP